MGQTSPEIINEVEKGLEHRMSSVMSQQFENAGGVPTVAEILNVIDRATERSLLENLAQEDPDLVEEIRRLMFVFEDITKLGDRDIQIAAEERGKLAVGHGPEGRQRGTQARRSSATCRSGPPTCCARKWSTSARCGCRTSSRSQQQIVDIVRRLEDAGEITTHSDEEEEQFVQ